MLITIEDFLQMVRLLEQQQAMIDTLAGLVYVPGQCLRCRVNKAKSKYCDECGKKEITERKNQRRKEKQQ